MYKDKICIVCDKEFTPKTGSSKSCPGFCTDELRRFRERERDHRSRPTIDRECPFCSEVFSTRDSKRRYCFKEECNRRSIYENNKKSDEKRKGLRSEYSKNRYVDNKDAILARKKLAYRERRPDIQVKDGHSTCRITFAKIVGAFSLEGYKVLSTEYENTHQELSLICPKEHAWVSSYHRFNSGQRCYECQKYIHQSRPELEILGMISNMTSAKIIEMDKSLIGKELDIYIPDKKLAIEYCGLRWHGEVFAGKRPMYHRLKMTLCREKGVQLITIFEDEYIQRKEVVISRIQNALGLITEKVYARKCELKVVSTPEARAFFDQYHLQGSSPTSVCFGLYYKGELVQAMSLGPLSRKHAGTVGPVIELKRLANSFGIQVVGGASKLFSAAKKWAINKGFSIVKSYCDMRWASITPIYETLGFELVGESNYSPHYFKGQRRYRNQGLRKTAEERLTGKTEWELRKEQGFDRIWDCGHRTYVYKLLV